MHQFFLYQSITMMDSLENYHILIALIQYHTSNHNQMNHSQILIIAFLIVTSASVSNPGILLQLPQQLNLPIFSIDLPVSIPPILVSNLQLTEISLREINYTWKLEPSKFMISIPDWLVQFEWAYKKDEGRGTFTETYLQLTVDWQPAMDAHKKFEVKINKVSLKDGDIRSKIKIHLGGGVPETVLVQVTDIIINHARIIFRQALTSALTGLIQDLSSPIREDVKVLCPEDNDCIFFSTSLVAAPYNYQNEILVQLNGESYPQKSPSTKELNPSPALIKIPNNNSIIIQVHQQVINSVFKAYNEIKPIELEIKSTEISSITQITSQTLSMIFPMMRKEITALPVIFKLQIMNITGVSVVAEKNIKISTQISASILLQRSNGIRETYIKEAKGRGFVKIKIVTHLSKISLRLVEANISDIIFDDQDLVAGLVVPEEFQKHIPTLMQWLLSGSNGSLNEKIENLSFKEVNVNIVEQVFEQGSFGFQLVLNEESRKVESAEL